MCIKDIEQNLETIAYQKTIPFCYSCYKEAPTGTCKVCCSDDLMRLLPGSGCEFGLCRIRHKPYYPELNIMLNVT